MALIKKSNVEKKIKAFMSKPQKYIRVTEVNFNDGFTHLIVRVKRIKTKLIEPPKQVD